MDNNLLKIANTLTLDLHNVEEQGLIGGKMGATLFYYELSKYTGIKTFNDMADNLLDQVLNNLNKIETDSIERGTAGIGWGINYLIRSNFIEADEDLLDELELSLFSREKEFVTFDTNFTLLSPAIYLLSKSKESLFEKHQDWILNILNTCNYYCLSIYDNKKKPLDLINSMLHFLIELKKSFIYDTEVSKLIWKLENHLSNYENIINDKYGDSFVLLTLLEQIEGFSSPKNKILENLKNKDWDINAYKKILWQQILFTPDKERIIEIPDVNRLLSLITEKDSDINEILVPTGLYLMNDYTK